MISVLAYLQTKIQFEAFRFCQAKLGVWRSLQTLCSDSGPKPAVELTPQPRDLGRLVCEVSALTMFRHPAQKQTSSLNLRIAQYIRDSSCGDWKAYFPKLPETMATGCERSLAYVSSTDRYATPIRRLALPRRRRAASTKRRADAEFGKLSRAPFPLQPMRPQ